MYHHICYVLYSFSTCNAMIDPDPYVDQCIHDLVLCDFNTVVSWLSDRLLVNYVTLIIYFYFVMKNLDKLPLWCGWGLYFVMFAKWNHCTEWVSNNNNLLDHFDVIMTSSVHNYYVIFQDWRANSACDIICPAEMAWEETTTLGTRKCGFQHALGSRTYFIS